MKLINKLSRAFKAAKNEITKPESFTKGDEFENYVREIAFPKDYYDLVHKTASYEVNKDDYIESTKYPDFLFRCKKTGKEFYVEAKYRSKLYYNNQWCTSSQFERYRKTNKTKPVFLCIGFKGVAKSPEQIFIIPIYKIKDINLSKYFLKHYKFYKNKPVFSSYLWKL